MPALQCAWYFVGLDSRSFEPYMYMEVVVSCVFFCIKSGKSLGNCPLCIKESESECWLVKQLGSK